MTAIAVISPDWVLSTDYKHPIYRIEAETQHIRSTLRGKIVVYGMHTLECLPKKKPLPDCTNIVLAHDHPIIEGALTVSTINELRYVLKQYDTDDVFLIGGAATFAELIDDCKEAILTVVDEKIEKPNCALFPDLTKLPNWIPGKTGSEHHSEGHTWYYVHYINTKYRKHTRPQNA